MDGPIKIKFRDSNFVIFICVASFSHIFTFIAGAKNIFLFDAKIIVLIKSFADPLAIFSIIFAVAGAIRIRSAHLDKAM